MAKEVKKEVNVVQQKMGSGGGGVYWLGLVGAAIYYIQHATTFWEGALGILKAFVWPAFLAYSLLDFFKM